MFFNLHNVLQNCYLLLIRLVTFASVSLNPSGSSVSFSTELNLFVLQSDTMFFLWFQRTPADPVMWGLLLLTAWKHSFHCINVWYTGTNVGWTPPLFCRTGLMTLFLSCRLKLYFHLSLLFSFSHFRNQACSFQFNFSLFSEFSFSFSFSPSLCLFSLFCFSLWS